MENSVNYYDWCYLSGRVNVLECNLLNMNFFERVLSSENFENVLINLNNTFLKAYFTQVKHLYEFETLLDEYYYSRLYEVRSLSPDSAICNFFLIKNDAINLKNFIKAVVFGISVEKSLAGSINKDRWNDIWSGKDASLPEVFKRSISFIKKAIALQSLNQIVPSTSPTLRGGEEWEVKKASVLFIIDLIFDGAYLSYIENFYNEIKVEGIKRYLKIFQIARGLEIIRRAMILRFDLKLLNQYFLEGFDKEHLLRKLVLNAVWTSEETLREILEVNLEQKCLPPWGEEGVDSHSFFWSNGRKTLIQMLSSDLLRTMSFRYGVVTDDYLLDIMRPVKRIPFGAERVFGYLCGLTTEVFNLKLVLGGKVHGIENNYIRERLRKTYV